MDHHFMNEIYNGCDSSILQKIFIGPKMLVISILIDSSKWALKATQSYEHETPVWQPNESTESNPIIWAQNTCIAQKVAIGLGLL